VPAALRHEWIDRTDRIDSFSQGPSRRNRRNRPSFLERYRRDGWNGCLLRLSEYLY